MQPFWVQEGLFTSPILHIGHLTVGSPFPDWIMLELQGGCSQEWRVATGTCHGRICLGTGGGPGAEDRAQGTLPNLAAATHHQPWHAHEDGVLVSNLNCNKSYLLLKWYFSELLGTAFLQQEPQRRSFITGLFLIEQLSEEIIYHCG